MAIYRIKRFSIIEEEKSFGIIRDKLSKTVSKERENLIRRKEDSILNNRVSNTDVENSIISDNSDIAAVYPKNSDEPSPYMEGPNKERAKNIKDALAKENDFTEDDIKFLTLVMTGMMRIYALYTGISVTD